MPVVGHTYIETYRTYLIHFFCLIMNCLSFYLRFYNAAKGNIFQNEMLEKQEKKRRKKCLIVNPQTFTLKAFFSMEFLCIRCVAKFVYVCKWQEILLCFVFLFFFVFYFKCILMFIKKK